MGFRDPEYYATRTFFPNVDVQDEQTIREDYKFKLPPVVSSMENERTLISHVLGGTKNNIGHVEKIIGIARAKIQEFINMKKEFRT